MTDLEDAQSLRRAEDGRRPPQSASDDDAADEREVAMEAAAAAAEVALLDGHFQTANRSRRAAEEAVLGAVGDGPVEAYQATDESGRLVEQRFLTFLESL
jgi:hypothetical protein